MRLRRSSLIVAGVAGVAILAACGSSSKPATTTAPAAGTATTGAGTTSTAPVAGGALPSRPVPIPAGTYTTSLFRPQARLTLPAGWSLADSESPRDVYLANDKGSLRLLRVSTLQVFPPGTPPSATAATPPPADLLAWLKANPALKATGSGTATVAGASVPTLDATAAGADALLFLVGEFPAGIRAGTAARFSLLGAGADRVLVVENAAPGDLAAFTSTTASLLSGMTVDPSVPAAAAPATAGKGCSAVRTLPDAGHDHVDAPPAAGTYSSDPPTSGPHNPQWAPWGIAATEIPQYTLVHNLEHGGIVVQYGPGADRAAIERWANSDLPGIVVAPYAHLGDGIALTAWTHLLTCTAVDTAAFDAFRDAYRFRGREFFPIDAYAPGPAA